MTEHDGLMQRFTEHRGRLMALAYRMLGSRGDAEDALQESWCRERLRHLMPRKTPS